MNDAILHKGLENLFVQMLQLAATAKLEMRAWRIDMVQAVDEPASRIQAIARRCKRHMPTVCGHAIAARGYPDDFINIGHNSALPVRARLSKPAGLFLRGCLDIRRQTIFVIARTNLDHPATDQVYGRVVKTVGRG